MRRAATIVATLLILAGTMPAGAATSSRGQFVVRCGYSHTAADDPIVLPGQPGASHLHDFFGNVSASAGSTMESMLVGGTTCRAASDTAGYWSPVAYVGDRRLTPSVMRIYYLGTRGVEVGSFPPGLQIIGGSRDATSPEDNPHVRWYCGETVEVKTPKMPAPYDCTPWASYPFVDGVVAIIDLPNCWNGTGLRPEDVVYPVGGSCPRSHPRVLPILSERLHFGVMNPLAPDGSVALTLSSGPYYSMHADFWNTWRQERLDQLVADCLAAHVHCGSIDAEHEVAWTHQFGTARYDLANAAVPFGGGVAVAGFTAYELVPGGFRHRYDAFLRLETSTGEEVWTRQFGSSANDEILAVATDGSDLYVAGRTEGRLPGQRAAGGRDGFVARFGPEGRLAWLRQFGTPRDDEATALVADAGGVFVGGTTFGELGRSARGGSDGFVRRLTPDGEVTWTTQFGRSGDDAVAGLAALGNRLIAVGSASTGFRGTDGSVRSLSRTGRVRWSRSISTAGDDLASAVAAGGGRAFVVGSTDGDAYRPTLGGRDALLRAYDARGTQVFAEMFGGPGDDEATSVALGDAVYVAGYSTGSVFGEPALGESDAFVSRFLRKGVHIWTEQIGTADYDRAYGLAVDARGAYVVGTTHGAFEGQANAGDRDVFVTSIRFT